MPGNFLPRIILSSTFGLSEEIMCQSSNLYYFIFFNIFRLVPDMPRTLYHESTVQVLGEISEAQFEDKDCCLQIMVHFVRDFSTVNVDRYHKVLNI